jgi:hypothetical protein
LIPVKCREESLDRGCEWGIKLLGVVHDWRPDLADGGRIEVWQHPNPPPLSKRKCATELV